MSITRRSFLKLVGAALATGTSVPAMSLGRQPYVAEGEVADFIGPAGAGFIGGQIVHSIGSWDGIGYPVQVWDNAVGRRQLETYYDFDLCNFRTEVPAGFWHDQNNRKQYNNVHTYVRTKRFGESIQEAVSRLNFYSTRT